MGKGRSYTGSVYRNTRIFYSIQAVCSMDYTLLVGYRRCQKFILSRKYKGWQAFIFLKYFGRAWHAYCNINRQQTKVESRRTSSTTCKEQTVLLGVATESREPKKKRR